MLDSSILAENHLHLVNNACQQIVCTTLLWFDTATRFLLIIYTLIYPGDRNGGKKALVEKMDCEKTENANPKE